MGIRNNLTVCRSIKGKKLLSPRDLIIIRRRDLLDCISIGIYCSICPNFAYCQIFKLCTSIMTGRNIPFLLCISVRDQESGIFQQRSRISRLLKQFQASLSRLIHHTDYRGRVTSNLNFYRVPFCHICRDLLLNNIVKTIWYLTDPMGSYISSPKAFRNISQKPLFFCKSSIGTRNPTLYQIFLIMDKVSICPRPIEGHLYPFCGIFIGSVRNHFQYGYILFYILQTKALYTPNLLQYNSLGLCTFKAFWDLRLNQNVIPYFSAILYIRKRQIIDSVNPFQCIVALQPCRQLPVVELIFEIQGKLSVFIQRAVMDVSIYGDSDHLTVIRSPQLYRTVCNAHLYGRNSLCGFFACFCMPCQPYKIISQLPVCLFKIQYKTGLIYCNSEKGLQPVQPFRTYLIVFCISFEIVRRPFIY